MPPIPSEITPQEGGWNPANLELTHSVCAEGGEAVLEDDQETLQSGWMRYCLKDPVKPKYRV